MTASKIKICFFNSCKVWGGGEKWHYDVASGTNKDVFQVTIASNPNSELLKKAKSAKIQTYKIKISNLSFLNPIKIWILAGYFRRNAFSVIVLNLPSDLKLAGIAAKMAGIKRIIYRRGSAIPVKNSFLNRFLFKNIVSEILANSEETKNTILERNPGLFDMDKITVIYNGISKNKYPELSEINAPDFNEKPLIIGNVGRLDFQKAHVYLIELSKKLNALNINHKILIAGDGPLKSELERQIKSENLLDNIELFGFVEDIPQFLSQIDIFVLTSRWEGFGYVIAEAMASYKPSIAFNLSSNPELIQDGHTGFLIEPFNIDLLAESVSKIINSSELYESMSLNARKRFEEKFTFCRMIKNIEQYLEES